VRLLADENIPSAVVVALVEAGHEVATVRERVGGAADLDVARLAEAESRILLTFDKDFGGIAVRDGLAPAAGIILLRFVPRGPADAVRIVMRAIEQAGNPTGRLVVVERDRVRLRVLRQKRDG
jgi:predicted nuclease of predicted toxin-antitoxin system